MCVQSVAGKFESYIKTFHHGNIVEDHSDNPAFAYCHGFVNTRGQKICDIVFKKGHLWMGTHKDGDIKYGQEFCVV